MIKSAIIGALTQAFGAMESASSSIQSDNVLIQQQQELIQHQIQRICETSHIDIPECEVSVDDGLTWTPLDAAITIGGLSMAGAGLLIRRRKPKPVAELWQPTGAEQEDMVDDIDREVFLEGDTTGPVREVGSESTREVEDISSEQSTEGESSVETDDVFVQPSVETVLTDDRDIIEMQQQIEALFAGLHPDIQKKLKTQSGPKKQKKSPKSPSPAVQEIREKPLDLTDPRISYIPGIDPEHPEHLSFDLGLMRRIAIIDGGKPIGNWDFDPKHPSTIFSEKDGVRHEIYIDPEKSGRIIYRNTRYPEYMLASLYVGPDNLQHRNTVTVAYIMMDESGGLKIVKQMTQSADKLLSAEYKILYPNEEALALAVKNQEFSLSYEDDSPHHKHAKTR